MSSEAKTVPEIGAQKQLPAIVTGLLVGAVAGIIWFGLGYSFFGVNGGLLAGGISGAFTGLVAALMAACNHEDDRERAAWETVSQGAFDRVEYVPRGRYHHLATVIHFDDGRACVLMDLAHDIGFPRGTKIEVKKNGLNEYRIEVLK